VWIAYFEEENITKEKRGREGLTFHEGEDWKDVDMSTLKEMTQANETYRTPGKLKIGKFISKTTDAVVEGPTMSADAFIKMEVLNMEVDEESLRSSEENFNVAILTVLKQWNTLAKQLDVLNNNLMNTTAVGDGVFKEELVDTFVRVETKIKEADNRMKILISGVGADDQASDRGSTSVWSAIRGIQDQLGEIEEQMTLMYERLTSEGSETKRLGTLEREREMDGAKIQRYGHATHSWK
jgi:hypothetical protein